MYIYHLQGSTVLVEFLYQNGAKLAAIDMQGRGVLHYAALNDDTRFVRTGLSCCCCCLRWGGDWGNSVMFVCLFVCLLCSIVVMMMKRGAKCDVKDFDEKVNGFVTYSAM